MVLNNHHSNKFKFLILRILRKDANLIPEICRTPQCISKERMFRQDALTLHNIFKESRLINTILDIFNINVLEDFTTELLNHLGIGFNDEELLSIEIEDINKHIVDPMRLYRMLAPNNYTTQDVFSNTLEIKYFLETRYIHKSNKIYALISISNHCDDIITETIEKSVLLNHIDIDKKYHFICRSCHKEFEIMPSFLEFSHL